MQGNTKRLRVIAGPNGSGKSSVVFHILQNYYCGHFINADELNEQLTHYHIIDLTQSFGINSSKDAFNNYLKHQGESWLEKAKSENVTIKVSFKDNTLIVPEAPGGYDAAIAADFIRYQLLKSDKTFTFETVLSDARKINFLREAADAGFKIYLYFVCTVHPNINKLRVSMRVAKGGHFVPDDKIEKRYYNSLKLLPTLIPLTSRCFLFDNSEEGSENKLNLVASINSGNTLEIHSANMPRWVEEYVLESLF